MKQIKKIAAFVLVLSLTAALCACGGKKTDTAAETTAAETKAETEAVTGTVAETAAAPETATEKAAEKETETEAPTEAETETEAESETETDAADTSESQWLGVIDGNHFELADLGFAIDVPGDWITFTQDQLLQLAGLTKSLISSEEELTKVLEEQGVSFCYQSTTADGSNNINITVTDKKILGIPSIDEKTYCNLSVDAVKESMGAVGAEGLEVKVDTVEFLGKECPCTVTSFNIGDVGMFQLGIPFCTDDYIYFITITANSSEDAEKLLKECFSKL